MSKPSFVHLHVHTHYSLLDGATRVGPLVERAKVYDQPAVAITDHGNLFGVIEFYKTCLTAGIKPIIGCETYLASGDRRQKDRQGLKESYHLLLLAMNREGYHNLMRLSSIGYTEGFYRKPRIDKEVLKEHAGGLLCTSTCLGGEIPQAFLTKDRAAAEALAKTYLDIFGPDRFFIELQDHGMSEQRTINPELIDMARRLGVATIASNDVHYLEHDDVEAHDVLCCINTGSRLSEEDRFRFPSDQFYFKSPEEMAALFSDCPESLSNTLRVADLCNLELDLSQRHAPVFRVPDEVTDKKGASLDDNAYLRQLVYEGAAERYGEISDELRERIDYELEVITGKGFASYFLIVWDCVHFAREQGIPVGARGSGCSSVVSYCLHISAPDPIRYGLYFERFMDPDRDEMPDIDLDICQSGRADVLDYVREKYGHVAQIITFGTLKPRAAVKDVARVLGLGFAEANELTGLIPLDLNVTFDSALQQEPELKKRYDEDLSVRRIIDIARRLEGVARNAGVHAAGVVVADQPLVNFLPLYKAPDASALVTQYDGPTVESVGLLKMDFLGLRTLTTLERARQLVTQTTGETVDLEHLDLTDARVFELFARGDTKGIFQFESGGMREVILRMKPNRIEDLIAANALFRPGPMEYIPEYVARKHGRRWTTPHPIMTEVLEETYGIMVFQEQVSRLVNRLGGIELKAAFRLAKAISKKKTAMIEAMREPFLDGCVSNGVARDVAVEIFADILKFGGYAFNKAHSTGYALVAFQTAWMKTYYPVEFMAALMTMEMSSTEKVADYREACRDMQIDVDPPDINASEYDFTVGPGRGGEDRRVIRFGLGAIKGVGGKAAGAIVEARKEGGPFDSLFDFCERVDLSAVNRATCESLVCAGAFDSTGAMRKALFEALDRAMTAGQAAQQDRRAGQMSLFGPPAPPATREPTGRADDVREDDKTAPDTSGPTRPMSRVPWPNEAPPCQESTCRRPAAPGFGMAPSAVDKPQTTLSTAEWSESEMLAREKAVLGFYITRHPLTSHTHLLEACATAATADLAGIEQDREVVLGGIVSSIRTVAARNGRNAGKRLGIITFEDLAGRVEAVLFPDDFIRYRNLIEPDALLFLEGSVDKKREEPSLRVSRVVTADEAPQAFAAALLLEIDPDTDVEAVVAALREHPGNCRVYLDVSTTGGLIAQIECHAGMKVDCNTDLLAALVALLGRPAVAVLGPGRKPIPIS
ncbi:MAG: DNA polymerase III subunit alpha, partial [Phycisphaerae bacterium]